MNTERADHSPTKQEPSQPGDGEDYSQVKLGLRVDESLAGDFLPPQDVAAIREVILLAHQIERQRP